jgi:hypothetical protein
MGRKKKVVEEEVKKVDEPANGSTLIDSDKLREINLKAGFRTSADLAAALEEKAIDLVFSAQSRATANKRKSVKPADL